jgi:hypothetical protein
MTPTDPIAAVLHLHQPNPGIRKAHPTCAECGFRHPCLTRQILNGENK